MATIDVWAPTNALGETSVEGRHREHPEALGTDEQPRDDHALSTHLLVVERHEDHRAEERGAQTEGGQ
jgi:hypothetical protein